MFLSHVQSLVELGLFDAKELEEAILSDFNPIRGESQTCQMERMISTFESHSGG